MSENEKVTATIKAHGGYDASWAVFNSDTVAGLVDQINAAESLGLYAVIGKAQATFAAHGVVGNVLGATPVSPTPYQAPYQAPAAAPAVSGPPGSAAPSCPHGVKRYVTSKPGAAKAWKMWGCPAPQGATDQCKPEWIN